MLHHECPLQVSSISKCSFFTGIKSVALSYSRISLADVAEKLQLDSPEDAEYIIAKVN